MGHENNISFESILASQGFNNNNLYFDADLMLEKCKTVEDEPVNVKHKAANTVGVVTSAYPITDKDSLTYDGETANHILVSASVWKNVIVEKFGEYAQDIIEKILRMEYKVSMEMFIKEGAFAVGSGDDTYMVPLTQDTVWLMDYLVERGGPGYVGEYRVGVLPLDYYFLGMGLVMNPANPNSDIVSVKTAEEISISNTSEENMEALEQAQHELTDAQSKLAVAEKVAEEATVAKTALETELADAKASLEAVNAKYAEVATALAALTAEKEALAAQVAEQARAATLSSRRGQIAATGGTCKLSDEQLVAMADDVFVTFMESLAETAHVAKAAQVPATKAEEVEATAMPAVAMEVLAEEHSGMPVSAGIPQMSIGERVRRAMSKQTAR